MTNPVTTYRMSDPATDQIIAIVAKALGHRRPIKGALEIRPDSLLIEDLAADAIDIVCIANALEEALLMDIGDACIESWASVADICASVLALREAA